MANLLFTLLFSIISILVDTVVSPIVTLISNMFPDVLIYVENILQFFDSCCIFVGTVLRWGLFTNAMMTAIFGYFTIKFSLWVLSCSVRLAFKLYNLLKP